LGTEATVPTLEGDTKLKIRPVVRSGANFRSGIRAYPSAGPGPPATRLSLFFVTTPDVLTKEQRQLFEQLAESLGPPKQK